MKWTQCTRGFFTFSDDNTHLTLLFLAMFPCFKKKRRVLSFLYRTFIVSPFSRNAEAGRELGKHRTCAEALTALKCALKSNRKQKTEKKIRLLFFFFFSLFLFQQDEGVSWVQSNLKRKRQEHQKKNTHTHIYIYIISPEKTNSAQLIGYFFLKEKVSRRTTMIASFSMVYGRFSGNARWTIKKKTEIGCFDTIFL